MSERKSLFDNEGNYTQSAMQLSREVSDIMEKLMHTWVEQGYSVREVSHVLQGAVFDAECCVALDKKGKG